MIYPRLIIHLVKSFMGDDNGMSSSVTTRTTRQGRSSPDAVVDTSMTVTPTIWTGMGTFWRRDSKIPFSLFLKVILDSPEGTSLRTFCWRRDLKMLAITWPAVLAVRRVNFPERSGNQAIRVWECGEPGERGKFLFVAFVDNWLRENGAKFKIVDFKNKRVELT